VVARAWADPAYRTRLIADATPAIAELGYAGRQGEHIIALENTTARHKHGRVHAVLLLSLAGAGAAAGLVQIRAVSSKAVKDRRGVLRDFGFELPVGTDIRVWDSTAEIRYLVLPLRPAGTDGWARTFGGACHPRQHDRHRLAKTAARDCPDGRRAGHGRGVVRPGYSRSRTNRRFTPNGNAAPLR